MKKSLKIFGLAASLLIGFSSCEREDFSGSLGEGKVLLTATINSDVKIAARSAADPSATEEELAAGCEVWLSNSKGVVYRYQGLQNIPADGIKLLSDHYTVEAWTGDSVSASWDSRWFKGKTEFDVSAGQTTRVSVVCKIANTLATVNYADNVDEVLENYTMTVGHTRGELVFEGATDAVGYFMMPHQVTTLVWKLDGTLKSSGEAFTKEGEITDVKQAYKYNLKVSCDPTDSDEIGGFLFSVEVDPSEVEINESYDIVLAPQIEGYNFDINRSISGAQGTLEHYSVFVKSGTQLKNVILESQDFPQLLGFGDGEYDVDLFDALDEYKQKVTDGGISFNYMPNEDDGTSMMKIRFEDTYNNRLSNGRHSVKIIARDINGKECEATVRFNISDAKASAEELSVADVWTYDATLRGTILVDGASDVSFSYRRTGDVNWTSTPAIPEDAVAKFAKESTVTANIDGLTADTDYEFKVVVDDFESPSVTFRTGTDAQLPNASFENWQKPKNPWLIYGEGEEMFWDSGNHGSTTVSASGSVTTPVTSPVHSGTYSIQLKSTTVIIKFAAGNVFAGEYLDTSGTNGVLGWGRPFTGRPKQLKFWAHYTSKTIDRTDGGNDIPADVKESFAKGNPDVGTIYIALMDENTESYSGKRYPVIVKTSDSSSSRRLFDPYGSDKPHVIAYGIHDFTESTSGSELQEFTIDLDYFQNDKIPSYIIITSSASKGGDYFMGGAGSTLILDDLQLVY